MEGDYKTKFGMKGSNDTLQIIERCAQQEQVTDDWGEDKAIVVGFEMVLFLLERDHS